MQRVDMAACVVAGTVSAAAGGLMYGPGARTAFDDWHQALGGVHLDFENVAAGTNLLPGTDPFGVGARFASVIYTTGAPFGPEHVEVSHQHAAATYGNTIVGSPCGGCTDDGRVGYEIVFDEPQRRAGMMRLWNTEAATRFYAPDGTLLAQHRNTVGHEFVGWVGEQADGSDWVKRVLMDTAATSGTRQVGYTDHVYFGLLIPAPGAAAPLLLLACGRRRRR